MKDVPISKRQTQILPVKALFFFLFHLASPGPSTTSTSLCFLGAIGCKKGKEEDMAG
jgi:hypothetical protein